MKKVFIAFLTLAIVNYSSAQGIGEFFSQKKTQLRYYAQQIAAYKVYLEYLKKGYTICKEGLNTIGDIKDGNFKDHSTYFNSLKSVNPVINNSSKVLLIAKYQSQILESFAKLRKDCANNPYLTSEEIDYVNRVNGNMLKECDITMSDLNTVVTNNSSQMKDDERVEHIDQLYSDMNDKYVFTKSFSYSTYMLIAQRKRDITDVTVSNKLNSVL